MVDRQSGQDHRLLAGMVGEQEPRSAVRGRAVHDRRGHGVRGPGAGRGEPHPLAWSLVENWRILRPGFASLVLNGSILDIYQSSSAPLGSVAPVRCITQDCVLGYFLPSLRDF